MVRVVTKNEIEQVLFDGGKIRWTHCDAKASLLTRSGAEVGTIRFNTYLQLDIREVEMKLPFYNADGTINTNCSPFNRLRRPDAWCGYDDFQLKAIVLTKSAESAELKKYFKERIWR